eukprot:COSAG05_NODE_2727_length_2722_cov_13.450904_3_plen_54_part_00
MKHDEEQLQPVRRPPPGQLRLLLLIARLPQVWSARRSRLPLHVFAFVQLMTAS